jgi:hypothetical protein
MKRFWLVLLSLGLIMAFSVSAFAVDVKVSGDFYAAGLYLNKTTLNDHRYDYDRDNPSTAFFFQRLRVGTDFIVSPCLKLVTRFTAMERIWGGARSYADGMEGDGWAYNKVTQNTGGTAGTRAESENIAFDLAYIDYTSPIGLFRVGYQPDYEWGTIFDNRTTGAPAGTITYAVPIGPVVLVAQYAKEHDYSYSFSDYSTGNTTDQDYDSFRVGAIFNFNTAPAKGEVGALLLYNRDATSKSNYMGPYDLGRMERIYKVSPYFKATIGPVFIQGEFEYTFGDAIKAESPALLGLGHQPDVSISAYSVFLDATATFGPVYVGGSFAYLSGDDPGTTDKLEGSGYLGHMSSSTRAFAPVNTAGLDWNPCLILFNNDVVNYWVGGISGHSGSQVGGEMSNAFFFQGRVGVKPIPQLDAMISVSYAAADKKQDPKEYDITYGSNNYGVEVDITGTYKITNNLSYMLGFGYLFTGDYFKGYDYAGANYKTVDDYMVINKLTLTF